MLIIILLTISSNMVNANDNRPLGIKKSGDPSFDVSIDYLNRNGANVDIVKGNRIVDLSSRTKNGILYCDKNHTLHIKMSLPLDKSTVNNNNIYLLNISSNRKLTSILTIDDNDESIVYVKSPSGGYRVNEEYKLVITTDLYSKTRRNLKENYTTLISIVDDKPDAPSNVDAWDVSSSKIKLAWDKVEDADYYYIYDSKSYDGPYTPWYDKNKEKFKANWGNDYCASVYNLQPDTDRYYKVTSVKDGIESDFSNIVSAKTPSYSEVSTPRNVQAWAVSDTEIRLYWDEVEDADYYNIYYSDKLNGTYYPFVDKDDNIAKFNWYSDYSLIDDQCNPNETWYYKVVAVKHGKESDASEVTYAKTFSTFTLTPPSKIKAWAINDSTIRVYWDKVSNAEYYHVYYSDEYDGKYYPFLNDSDDLYKFYWSEDYCFEDPYNEPNSTTYYKVKSVGKGIASDFSDIVFATTSNSSNDNVTYRSLIVGNSNYEGDEYLSGPQYDVENMRELFIKAKLGQMDSSFSSINDQMDLNKSQILREISNTFKDADYDDVSYFYFSGHGTVDPRTNTAYIVPLDATYQKDYISVHELEAALSNIRGTKVVIIDACFSGGFIDKSSDGETTEGSSKEINLEDMHQIFNEEVEKAFGDSNGMEIKQRAYLNSNQYKVLTSANGGETSLDFGYGGEFTLYFLEACGFFDDDRMQADCNGNNIISLDEIYTYCEKNVRGSQVQVFPKYSDFEIFSLVNIKSKNSHVDFKK